LFGRTPVDLIGVPLKRASRIFGALVVQSYDDQVRYSQEDLEVLLFVSQHVMTAMDRVKSRELNERIIRDRTKQLREINEELQEEIKERQRIESLQRALFDISELSVMTSDDTVEFYSNIHSIISRLIYAPNCYVATYDKDKDFLHLPYFSDKIHSDVPLSRPVSMGLTEYVLREGKAKLITPLDAVELAEKALLDAAWAAEMKELNTYWLGVPLLIDNQAFGLIAVQSHHRDDPYTDEDLKLLRFVSQHIAVAIERKKASEAIREYNLKLSDRIKERTRELDQANQDLKYQIEERKEIELKLIHDAHHDTLTGLPNRAMFSNRLELALANKKRYPQNNFAVLFIDLDRFKLINDTLGHHAGDLFLIEVANRIGQCIRGHDLLARLGGDEFVILLDNFEELVDVEYVSGRILEVLAKPFLMENREMYSGGSIGIAFIESHYNGSEEIIRDADAAMYQAKGNGRGRSVMFDKGMRDRLLQELELESAFRRNLKDGSFECQYQPVVDLPDNQWKYVELYIRWHHPYLGKVKREQFLQVSEHTGLTIEMDNFLLRQVKDLMDKMENERGLFSVAINISIQHLLQAKLVNRLIETIKELDIDPKRLVFEFDENALNRRSQFILPAIRKLKDVGITLVLDNFGSGLASLSYLYSYPFDYVKIDHRFVKSLPRSERNLKLIQSVLVISEHMGFTLIADGLEDKEQFDTLIEMGCKVGQGRYLFQPVALQNTPVTE
jgi:diguanylate cyclase (GGDEF)-like protein